MKLMVVDEKKHPITEPYMIRLPGWTEERYLRDAPDDVRCEFVQGDLIMYCPMSVSHSKIVGFLYSLLKMYCDVKGEGEVLLEPTTRLFPEVNRQPDICFVPKEQAHLADGLPMTVVPSFVIEVSWTTQGSDLGEKALDYQNARVEEYWVVDIENQQITVHLLKHNTYLKTRLTKGTLISQVIPEFSIEITWLWQSPLPSAFECLKKILGM